MKQLQMKFWVIYAPAFKSCKPCSRISERTGCVCLNYSPAIDDRMLFDTRGGGLRIGGFESFDDLWQGLRLPVSHMSCFLNNRTSCSSYLRAYENLVLDYSEIDSPSACISDGWYGDIGLSVERRSAASFRASSWR